MNLLGYSTGAIAFPADFSRAVDLLARYEFDAIELSALRISEVLPLIDELPNLSLGRYKYISFHAQVRLQKRKRKRWLVY